MIKVITVQLTIFKHNMTKLILGKIIMAKPIMAKLY
jgi:hypothetical protein